MTSVGLFYVARKVTHFLFITSSFLNDTFTFPEFENNKHDIKVPLWGSLITLNI